MRQAFEDANRGVVRPPTPRTPIGGVAGVDRTTLGITDPPPTVSTTVNAVYREVNTVHQAINEAIDAIVSTVTTPNPVTTSIKSVLEQVFAEIPFEPSQAPVTLPAVCPKPTETMIPFLTNATTKAPSVGGGSELVYDPEWSWLDIGMLVFGPVGGTLLLTFIGLLWNFLAEFLLHRGYGKVNSVYQRVNSVYQAVNTI